MSTELLRNLLRSRMEKPMATTTAKSLLKEPVQVSVRFEGELLEQLRDLPGVLSGR